LYCVKRRLSCQQALINRFRPSLRGTTSRFSPSQSRPLSGSQPSTCPFDNNNNIQTMSSTSQSRQASSRELPALRQGRRGRNFGALLTSSDAADPPAALTSSPARESKAKQAARLQSSKQPTKSTQPRKRDAPPHQAEASISTAPETEDSGQTQLADSDRLTQLSAPGNVSQGQSQIKPSVTPATPPAESGETCLICAQSIKYFALGSCSHRTCHVCALRMRALYKKRECALCKTELNDVIFTADPAASFSSYDLSGIQFKDPHLSIYCETFEQLEELLAYLKFNCPHPECSSVLSNWKDLKSHARTAHHGLSLCDLCCTNKKVFAHEHTLFTAKGLTMHMNKGSVGVGKGLRRSHLMTDDDTSKATDQDDADGFQGHPRCGFCSVYYYDDDQLYQHCRDKHEQCFICVRNGVGRWQYYLDYKHLESHFRDDHYLCRQTNCLQSRFVVFETALELQTHQIEAHGAEMGMRAVKDARKLETNFVYTRSQEQHSQTHTNRPANREQRAGRGIAVMDIPPISGEGSTTLSNANRIVPGLAPNSERSNSRRPHKGKSKSAPTDETEGPNLEPSSSTLHSTNQGESSSSNQREVERHAVLMQRVAAAVKGAEAKTISFKAAVRTYRNNEMAASHFLDTLCNIFDHRFETIGPILSNLLDILDIGDDRKGQLLEKWLDLKLDQTQYPYLAGNSSNGNPVGVNTNFHSSSSLSGLGFLQASSWVRQQPSYSKLLEKTSRHQNRQVPGLVPKNLKSGGKTTATPWASGSSNTTPVNNVALNAPRPTPTKSASSAGTSANAQNVHFPSLPTKPGPSKPSWKPNGGRQDGGTTAPHQWITSTNDRATTSNNQSSAPGNKKPKKVVLYSNSR